MGAEAVLMGFNHGGLHFRFQPCHRSGCRDADLAPFHGRRQFRYTRPLDVLSAPDATFADVEQRRSHRLRNRRRAISRPIGRLIRSAISSIPDIRNPCRDHGALAFVEMPAMEVEAQHEGERVIALVLDHRTRRAGKGRQPYRSTLPHGRAAPLERGTHAGAGWARHARHGFTAKGRD